MAATKKVYCSVLLRNNMEYMVFCKNDWSEQEQGIAFTAKTLDGKPIRFMSDGLIMIREVSKEEYDAWQKAADQYRKEEAARAAAPAQEKDKFSV